MSQSIRWTINSLGQAFAYAHDYSNASPILPVGARYIAGKLDLVLMKIPGGTYWASMSEPRKSAKGRFLLLQVIEIHSETDFSTLEVMELPLQSSAPILLKLRADAESLPKATFGSIPFDPDKQGQPQTAKDLLKQVR